MKLVTVIEHDPVPGSNRCLSGAMWETQTARTVVVQCAWDAGHENECDHRANTRAGRAVVWPSRVKS